MSFITCPREAIAVRMRLNDSLWSMGNEGMKRNKRECDELMNQIKRMDGTDCGASTSIPGLYYREGRRDAAVEYLRGLLETVHSLCIAFITTHGVSLDDAVKSDLTSLRKIVYVSITTMARKTRTGPREIVSQEIVPTHRIRRVGDMIPWREIVERDDDDFIHSIIPHDYPHSLFIRELKLAYYGPWGIRQCFMRGFDAQFDSYPIYSPAISVLRTLRELGMMHFPQESLIRPNTIIDEVMELIERHHLAPVTRVEMEKFLM